MDEVALIAIDSLFRDGATRTNETALMSETTSSTKPPSRSDRAALRLVHQSHQQPQPKCYATPHRGTLEQPTGCYARTQPPKRTPTTNPTMNATEWTNTLFTLYHWSHRPKVSLYGWNFKTSMTFHLEWNYCHRRGTNSIGHKTSSS
jgi:hypothetical protein